jgi:hypothetical protein
MHTGSRKILALTLTLLGVLLPADIMAQRIRGGRGAVYKGEEGGAAVGRRGAVVKGDEGYAAVGRRGAAVKTEEGYAAAGRRGAVAKTEEGYARVGPRGAVVAGEEGAAAVGRYGGVVVGNRYESYEAWRVVAGVGTAIAVGTMLARPPASAVTVAVGGSSYWYQDGAYFTRVMTGGAVAYQAVAPPVGVVVPRLPVGCTAVRMGAVAYQRCGTTYYQPVGGGFRVVVLR